jgi:hypothetical protein
MVVTCVSFLNPDFFRLQSKFYTSGSMRGGLVLTKHDPFWAKFGRKLTELGGISFPENVG